MGKKKTKTMVVENMMTTSIVVQLAAIDLINAEVPAVIPTTGYPYGFITTSTNVHTMKRERISQYYYKCCLGKGYSASDKAFMTFKLAQATFIIKKKKEKSSKQELPDVEQFFEKVS